jgi:ABC-2 type transport system permease protein
MPVFDQGYQHWSGELSSPKWRWLAITRRGLKTALQGRPLRMTLILAWLPALILVFILCMWGLVERQSALVESVLPFLTSLLGRPIVAGPRDYRVEIWTLCFHYFLLWELWFSMVLVLLVGPNLISQDLRYNALPMYFSRPLRRMDYFLGKLGIIAALLAAIIIVPSLIAYLLGMLFSLDVTIIRDTLPILLGAVTYGFVITISAGMLMLALSSISRNSRYIALFWMGIWILSGTVSLVLLKVQEEHRFHTASVRGRFGLTDDLINAEIQAAKTDWRPLISYTSNLRRIQEHLLHTNAAWERLSQLSPDRQRRAILFQLTGNQYPWYWSAAVLAGLFVLSIVVLNYSVKPLDRLK